MKMRLVSLFNSPASWAKIAREISVELEKLFDFNYCEQKGFLYKKDLFKKYENEHCEKNDFELLIDHPDNLLKKRQADISICHFIYEYKELSQEWINGLQNMDGIWVPNEYNKNILIENNITVPILVSPYGSNIKKQKIDYAKKYIQNVFLFRVIMMPQKRKGIRELVEAFKKEFTKTENAKLQIKIPYNIQKSEWDINIQNMIKSANNNIEFIDKIYSEKEIENFIKNAHVYIQPSYSEGFGLSILDSLKSNVPVIVGETGGHKEFFKGKGGLFINSKIKKMNGILYSDKKKTIEIKTPEIKDLMKKMRKMYEDREYCVKLAKETEELDLSQYSWKKTANKIKDFLIDLKGRRGQTCA
ncbi:MAG: glycosyltransferase [Candidatus Muirbacterium halophilum]|nr:glycosyltransferase [Candidatus Muirbacterium halophilum]MCK9476267.1 glycosyltransferase [Candidatus Muirbacterium halophilum]